MILVTLCLAAGTMFLMALIFSCVLGWANTAFHVEVDLRIDDIFSALPGANCGGCDYIGCRDYAEAIVNNKEVVNKCTVGGATCAQELADIMGVGLDDSLPYFPIVHCGADYESRLGRSTYLGRRSCAAANLVADVQGCTFGCLGFGDCSKACKYDALHVIRGLAVVDYEKCISCGACSKVCPRNIITMVPFKSERVIVVICSNKDTGKDVKKVCKVGCLGCGSCARHSSFFKMENNLPKIDYTQYPDQYNSKILEACQKCPRQQLVFKGKGEVKSHQ